MTHASYYTICGQSALEYFSHVKSQTVRLLEKYYGI